MKNSKPGEHLDPRNMSHLLTSYSGRGFKSRLALHSSQGIVPSHRAEHNLNQCQPKQNPRARMNWFTLPKTKALGANTCDTVCLRELKMATKIRQFYRLNFVLSANISFSRKPIFVLPLRLPITVTLYKLRLSAYRNFSALVYHHRYDLASLFTAYQNHCETASCIIPRFPV
jgi:hypothetical protein